MKPAAPTVSFALRTAKGEQRRIRAFLRQVEDLGVPVSDLPTASVRALGEAERFLGKYLDTLAHETPTPQQLEGVIEALGGIDRVVKRSMAEILKSLGWRPDNPVVAPKVSGSATVRGAGKEGGGKQPGEQGNLIKFPDPGKWRPRS